MGQGAESQQATHLYSSRVKMGMREGCNTVISTNVLFIFTGSPSSKAITTSYERERGRESESEYLMRT